MMPIWRWVRGLISSINFFFRTEITDRYHYSHEDVQLTFSSTVPSKTNAPFRKKASGIYSWFMTKWDRLRQLLNIHSRSLFFLTAQRLLAHIFHWTSCTTLHYHLLAATPSKEAPWKMFLPICIFIACRLKFRTLPPTACKMWAI